MTADDPRPAGEACKCYHQSGCSICARKRKPIRHMAWCPAARPAASGGATDGEREAPCRCGHFESLHGDDDTACLVWRETYQGRLYCPCPSFDRPAPRPVASQADGELREEIANWWSGTHATTDRDRAVADAVLALPAVRQLLAVQEAAVEAIREVHQADGTEPHACDWCGEAWPCTPIRTLDGTGRPARAESGSRGDSERSTYQGGVR